MRRRARHRRGESFNDVVAHVEAVHVAYYFQALPLCGDVARVVLQRVGYLGIILFVPDGCVECGQGHEVFELEVVVIRTVPVREPDLGKNVPLLRGFRPPLDRFHDIFLMGHDPSHCSYKLLVMLVQGRDGHIEAAGAKLRHISSFSRKLQQRLEHGCSQPLSLSCDALEVCLKSRPKHPSARGGGRHGAPSAGRVVVDARLLRHVVRRAGALRKVREPVLVTLIKFKQLCLSRGRGPHTTTARASHPRATASRTPTAPPTCRRSATSRSRTCARRR